MKLSTDYEEVQQGLAKAIEEYFDRLKDKALEAGEEWNDERMDIIGQNGNDGLHYDDDKEGM